MDSNVCLCKKSCSIKTGFSSIFYFENGMLYDIEATSLGFRLINNGKKVFVGKTLFKLYFISQSDDRESKLLNLLDDI